MTVRIIGDVHGKMGQYIDIIEDCEYSVQLGDMAFEYKFLDYVDSDKHKFFSGNHDNMDTIHGYPHSLGNSGNVFLGDISFFFVRGASSIDKKQRQNHQNMGYGKCWWSDEQLDTGRLQAAIDYYAQVKPKIMLSHTCPTSVAQHIGNPGALLAFGHDPNTYRTDTQEALQRCFESHQPDLWVYGHFHQSRVDIIGGTKFVCLDELGYVDIDDAGNIL